MASQQNLQSKPLFATSHGTMRSQPKANTMQAIMLANSRPFFDRMDYLNMVRNATYRFEVTKQGPILSDKPLEELQKAWCLYKSPVDGWIIIYMRHNNGKMKCFNHGTKNIPSQLHGQLMLLGVTL